MPKLRQLEYLVALADARTFREAATATHVTQPTLTQQIQALEKRLGAILVKRNTTPVELTPLGRDVVRRARRVLMEVADIRKIGRLGDQGVAGIVKLGISPTLGPYIMPEAVARLHRRFPDLRLHLVEGVLASQLAALRRGELDMLIATKAVSGSDLEWNRLFREPLHLVAPPDHPLAGRAGLHAGDLAGAEAIGLGAGHALQEKVIELCGMFGIRLEYDYQGSSLDSVCQMVASGLGLAVLPELYLRSAVGGRNVVTRLNVADWDASREIFAVWRKGSPSTIHSHIAESLTRMARQMLAPSEEPAR